MIIFRLKSYNLNFKLESILLNCTQNISKSILFPRTDFGYFKIEIKHIFSRYKNIDMKGSELEFKILHLFIFKLS